MIVLRHQNVGSERFLFLAGTAEVPEQRAFLPDRSGIHKSIVRFVLLPCLHIIIKERSIDYKYELTQTQKDLLATGGVKWEEISPGMLGLVGMDYISMPFEVENVGSGAALCFQVGFYLDDGEKRGINFFTIKPNASLYIHIFANTVEDKLDKNYCLEFVYRDILGTQYSQKYPVRFERDKLTSRINHQIDLTGTQEVYSEVKKDRKL